MHVLGSYMGEAGAMGGGYVSMYGLLHRLRFWGLGVENRHCDLLFVYKMICHGIMFRSNAHVLIRPFDGNFEIRPFE